MENVDNTSDADKPLSTATKKYVDDSKVDNTVFKQYQDATQSGMTNLENSVKATRDIFNNDLSMNNNKINQLADPTEQTDAVNKKYLDSKLLQHSFNNRINLNEELSLLRYEIDLIRNPSSSASLAYVVTPQNCVVDDNNKVSQLNDSVGINHLIQSDQAKQPVLKKDDQNRYYLRFDSSLLYQEFNSIYLCSSGNVTSFMFIAKTDAISKQIHIMYKDTNDGIFRAYFPWDDGNIYIDHANKNSGRMTVSNQQNLTGNIESYFYERNGANAKLYRGGTEITSSDKLTSNLDYGSRGTFMLGAENYNDMNSTKMDFYALFFWNRQLNTDEEKQKMFDYSKKWFGA